MTDNRPVVKFCPECGKPTMPGMMFCTNCGAKLPVLPVQETTKPIEVKKPEPQKQTVNPVSQPSVTQQNTNAYKAQPVKPVETSKPVTDTTNTVQTPQQNVVKPAETKKEEPQKQAEEIKKPEPETPVTAPQPVVQNTVKTEEPVKQNTNVASKPNTVKPAEVKTAEPQMTASTAQPVGQSDAVNKQEVKKEEPQKQTGNTSSQTNSSDPNVLHYTYTAQGTQQTNGAQGAPQVTVSVPYNQPYNNPSYINQYQMQMEYKPISAWGYLGYELLFLLPVVGWIIMIIMCFAPTNKNVKNFARAHVILYIILIVLIILLIAAAGASLDYLFSQFSL